MDVPCSATPHVLTGSTTNPVHILQPVFNVWRESALFLIIWIKEREWNQTSAVSFLKDDLIPELVVSCTGHTVASIKEVYFYACWMMYKRNIFQRFPSPSELAIHNDWNRGEWIPKPSSFKSRGIHATYESVFQEEQEPRHLCDLAETDPFYQNTGNRKTWIIWSHCIWWAYTLPHNRTCPALLLTMKSSAWNW